MQRRRRIDLAQGREAVQAWQPGAALPRATLATAVRFSLEELADCAPGASVEVRVPPYGVTQCIEGPRHTRGTPPNVVETDPQTWLGLVTGRVSWADAVAGGRVRASGGRADLSPVLPLTGLTAPGSVASEL